MSSSAVSKAVSKDFELFWKLRKEARTQVLWICAALMAGTYPAKIQRKGISQHVVDARGYLRRVGALDSQNKQIPGFDPAAWAERVSKA